ncbi:MAG TPA: enoyl-CoA hydratase-related protein [Solirubrobacterales bacterium]|nr:enoyl-CoA hydratase-related protein [Solirubrobacterales bacterium]
MSTAHADGRRPLIAAGPRDGVLRLTLDRPERLNAFSLSLVEELREALRGAAADVEVRCVVLTGAGRAFAVGADLGGDLATGEEARGNIADLFNPIIVAIRRMPKPVVAAVNGPAVGAGCSLAMACDQVVAAASACFSLSFARVGLIPDGAALLTVSARAGAGRTARLALLADKLTAEEALAWGLVDEVVADERHEAATAALAARLAGGPPLAYAAIKEELNRLTYPGLEELLDREAAKQAELIGSRDCAEGVRAFAERREPVFRGA